MNSRQHVAARGVRAVLVGMLGAAMILGCDRQPSEPARGRAARQLKAPDETVSRSLVSAPSRASVNACNVARYDEGRADYERSTVTLEANGVSPDAKAEVAGLLFVRAGRESKRVTHMASCVLPKTEDAHRKALAHFSRWASADWGEATAAQDADAISNEMEPVGPAGVPHAESSEWQNESAPADTPKRHHFQRRSYRFPQLRARNRHPPRPAKHIWSAISGRAT